MSADDNQIDEAAERVGFAFDCDFFLRGSFQVPGYVILDPDLTDAACRTLMVIMQHAWKDGECWPGLDRIADMRGKGRDAVIRHIRELVNLAHLTKHRRGQGKTNLYVINTQRNVILSRSSKSATSGSSENATLSISSLMPFALTSEPDPGQVAAHGQSSTGHEVVGVASKSERIKRVLNQFRDRHLKRKGIRYMIKEPGDRVLAASMAKAYTDEQIVALMAIYFQKPHASYSFGGFYKMIPTLVSDYETAREEKKSDTIRETELEMVERMMAAWDKGLTDREERITGLEGTIERLTAEQRIPDEAMRKRLGDVQDDLTAVHRSILAVLCKTLGVPPYLKRELHQLLDEDYEQTRQALVRMQVARTKRGGDKQ